MGAACIALAAPAFAQDGQTGFEDDLSANEIVITATRRAQTVQDVPIAVTAISGDLITNAGVTDIRGFEQLSSSLEVFTGQSASTGTSLSIRGIGTAGDNPGFEPAVGVFIDGVYRARAGLALAELAPIDRVEVLRGPQGTLFGRNTSAGALSIITEGPSFDLGGYAEASYGNYNAISLKGGITGAVTDTVALRLDGIYRTRDGYIRDVNSDQRFNDLDRHTLRAQALVEKDDLTIRFIADYSKTNEQCCGAVNVVQGPTAPAIQMGAALAGVTGIYTGKPSDRRMAVTPGRSYDESVKEWGVSAEITYAFETVTFTSITAWRDWDVLRNQDIDFSGFDRAYREGYKPGLRDFTQEVRLQGSALDDRLDWLVGGFYLNEKLTLTDRVRFGTQANFYSDALFAPSGFELFDTFGPAVPEFGQVLMALNPALAAAAADDPALFALLNSPLPGGSEGDGQINDRYRVKTEALALFTHNVFEITDNLKATLGLRWNHEKKTIGANLNAVSPTCDFYLDPSTSILTNALAAIAPDAILLTCNPTTNPEFNGLYSGNRSENEFTGTAKLAYSVTPDFMLYGGYDRGYKSGGYNLDRGGFDSVILGGDGGQIEDLEFESEKVDSWEIGFKSQWGRAFTLNIAAFYQDFSNYQQLVFSGNSFVTMNVDETVSKGVEAESTIRPARDLIFQLGYSLVDAKIKDSSNLAGTPLEFEAGKQMSQIPRHTITGAATWTPPLSDTLNALVHADFRFQSEQVTSSQSRGIADNEGFAVVNARIGVASADAKWRLELFVENLFDKYYHIATFAVPEQPGTIAAYPAQPRFYGVTARVGF
nr:TonB-dependent receptor [Sphingosinicella soli]